MGVCDMRCCLLLLWFAWLLMTIDEVLEGILTQPVSSSRVILFARQMHMFCFD